MNKEQSLKILKEVQEQYKNMSEEENKKMVERLIIELPKYEKYMIKGENRDVDITTKCEECNFENSFNEISIRHSISGYRALERKLYEEILEYYIYGFTIEDYKIQDIKLNHRTNNIIQVFIISIDNKYIYLSIPIWVFKIDEKKEMQEEIERLIKYKDRVQKHKIKRFNVLNEINKNNCGFNLEYRSIFTK